MWFLRHNLKVNEDKTRVICFTPKKSITTPIQSFTFGSSTIVPVSTFKNLGVTLDSFMNMEKHVNSLTQSAYFHLRNISKIRRYLTLDAAKTLAHTLVISRIDYCNGILGNLPLRVTNKLQRVQNTAARMLYKKPKRTHTTPLLKQLHWLPVIYRIKFKILLLTFKSLNQLAPPYLKFLIKRYVPSRQLRSNLSLQDTLVVPRYRRRKHAGRSFSTVAPTLWNELPQHIRKAGTLSTFKSLLKTFYFNRHFTAV